MAQVLSNNPQNYGRPIMKSQFCRRSPRINGQSQQALATAHVPSPWGVVYGFADMYARAGGSAVRVYSCTLSAAVLTLPAPRLGKAKMSDHRRLELEQIGLDGGHRRSFYPVLDEPSTLRQSSASGTRETTSTPRTSLPMTSQCSHPNP